MLSLSLSLNKQTNDVKFSYIYTLRERGRKNTCKILKQKTKEKKSNYNLEGSFLNCLEEYWNPNQKKGKVGTVVDDYK